MHGTTSLKKKKDNVLLLANKLMFLEQV